MSSFRFLTYLCSIISLVSAFSVSNQPHGLESSSTCQRRNFLQTSSAFIAIFASNTLQTKPSWAIDNSTGDGTDATNSSSEAAMTVKSVQTPLYYILRVREATEQETRLIKSGKFKDVQRANVKLAVRFMIENYRLNDNFIAASAFLSEEKKIKAVDVGQNVVQNLYTILEYFDSSDVENIKIGSMSMGGKEKIVIDGLTSARKGIDDYLSYFSKDDLNAVMARIESENELNRSEFDKELNAGQGIINMKPQPEPYKVQE